MAASTRLKPRLPETRPMSARSANPTTDAPIAPGSASIAPSVNAPMAHTATDSPRNMLHALPSTTSQFTALLTLQKLV
jgi:hypothetical protein